MRAIVLSVAAMAMTVSLGAQSASKANPADVRTNAAIVAQAKTLLAKAHADPTGLAVAILEKYPDQSFTELVARTKDGGAEQHAGFSDFFIVQDGEAVVLTGGKIVDGKDISPGETRGSKVVGGTPHPLHKGDIMHVEVGIPHQTTVPAGKTFVYYVIKIPAAAKK